MSGPWATKRLIFRAPEVEDEPFVGAFESDPEAFVNQSIFLPTPRSKKTATGFREFLESCILSAIVCLPAPALAANAAKDDVASKPIPIGVVHLMPGELRSAHHRHSEIGVGIIAAYQGKGYGTEAIKWALKWGFRYAGLHRIEINAFEWNAGARKLYESIGFKPEGRRREYFWFDGRFWDDCIFGMLESEWRERYGKEEL